MCDCTNLLCSRCISDSLQQECDLVLAGDCVIGLLQKKDEWTVVCMRNAIWCMPADRITADTHDEWISVCSLYYKHRNRPYIFLYAHAWCFTL